MFKRNAVKIIVLAIVASLSVGILLTGCGNQQAETPEKESEKSAAENKIVLRYAEVNPDSDPITMAANEFARIVKEKSNGRIEIKVFPGGQLGGQKDQIQSLQMGALDIARTQPAYLADAGAKAVSVYSLPYLFSDVDHAWTVLDGPLGQQLLDEVKAANIKLVGIGYYATSPRHFFFTDKKVTKLSDLKGLKLRVPTGEMYKDMVEAFGASSTPIAFSELYSALQTGIVDGAENPIKGYFNNKYYEICKYVTLDAHQADPSVIVFSEMVWNKLSEDDQRLIKEAVAESAKYYRDLSKQKEDEYMSELEKMGIEILEVENPQEWIDAVKPLYKKYGAGYEDIIELIQGIK